MRSFDVSYGRFTRLSYPDFDLVTERELSSAYRTLHQNGRLVAQLVRRGPSRWELSRARSIYAGAGRAIQLRCIFDEPDETAAEERAVRAVADNPDDFLLGF